MISSKPHLLQHLIDSFYAAFSLEEQTLLKTTNPPISFRESHVMSTIHDLKEINENTSTRIAAKTFMQRPALSLCLGSLERKGYIHRIHSTNDRRNVYVELTKQGDGLLAKHRAFQTGFVNKYLELFPESKRELVEEVFATLRNFFYSELGQK